MDVRGGKGYGRGIGVSILVLVERPFGPGPR